MAQRIIRRSIINSYSKLKETTDSGKFLLSTLPCVTNIYHQEIGLVSASERDVFWFMTSDTTKTRDRVTENLIENAKKMGANGVIGLRYQISFHKYITDICVYGTAIIIENPT